MVRDHPLEIGQQLQVLSGREPGFRQGLPELFPQQVKLFRLVLKPGNPGESTSVPSAETSTNIGRRRWGRPQLAQPSGEVLLVPGHQPDLVLPDALPLGDQDAARVDALKRG